MNNMVKQIPYTPPSVSHPGETLFDKLEEMGIGPKEFAIRADKPEKTITAILNGESSITPDMAIQFERVLNIPAGFWLQRQANYDEYVAREKEIHRLLEAIPWMKTFPIAEMIDLNWIPKSNSDLDKSRDLLNFFGIASFNAWESYYLGQKLRVAFRISLAGTKQPAAISAWLRRGELLANELKAPEYDKTRFEQILQDLKKIMVKQPQNFEKKVQTKALEAGVKVIYSTCLPKASLNGATRWIGNNPVIQLSEQFKRKDVFWFTLFHEAGHIVKHGKKDIFLEDIDYSEKDLQKEKEANEFADKWTFISSEVSLPVAAEPKVRYKGTRDIPSQFPRVIEGISSTDLHAGILAMIISAHETSSEHHMKLSHIKGEKIVHLVESHIGIDLGRNPMKDAAGPDDYQHLKKIEHRANKANWFEVKNLTVGKTYIPKSGMSRSIMKVKGVLTPEDLQEIESLIATFLPFDLEHAEVIATLYAGWNNLLLEGKRPTDEEIVYESRENWSQRKLGIDRELFFKAIKWMKGHGLVPAGKGKMVSSRVAKR